MKTKKILTLMLSLALTFVFLIPSSVYADTDTAVPYASQLISSYKISVNALGNGKMEIAASVDAKRKIEKLGFESIEVQELNNSSWKTVKTYKDSLLNNMIDKNCSSMDVTLKYSGTSGKTYRAIGNIIAKDGIIEETRSITSYSEKV